MSAKMLLLATRKHHAAIPLVPSLVRVAVVTREMGKPAQISMSVKILLLATSKQHATILLDLSHARAVTDLQETGQVVQLL